MEEGISNFLLETIHRDPMYTRTDGVLIPFSRGGCLEIPGTVCSGHQRGHGTWVPPHVMYSSIHMMAVER